MAFRPTTCWKSMLSRLRGRGSPMFGTSTSPKMKAYAPTADFAQVQQAEERATIMEWMGLERMMRGVVEAGGEFVPVHVALGMIVLSATLGLHTAKQQLMYSPSVHVIRKKRRKTLPELEEPDHVVEEALNFITKSFFRKVAHLQQFHPQLVPAAGVDVFARHLHAEETLKSVGIDPKQH